MVRVRGWLAEAWDLIGADMPVFLVAGFLTISLSMLSLFILTLPLISGLCIMFSEKLQGNKPELSHLWEGLSSRFPAAITIWIIYMIAAVPFDVVNFYLNAVGGPWRAVGVSIITIGLWALSLPLFFTLPLIADRDVSARDAISLSWAQVRPRWGGILAAEIVYTIVMVCGLLACGVGIIITLPVVVGAMMLAYRELYRDFAVPQMIPIKDPGEPHGEGEDDAQDQ
ncbi:MAG: hypothetical protein ACM3VW_09970 [Bacteroidota bacterium]